MSMWNLTAASKLSRQHQEPTVDRGTWLGVVIITVEPMSISARLLEEDASSGWLGPGLVLYAV
jgi:hypothetical protein